MNILDIYETRNLENKSKENLIELIKEMKEEYNGIYVNTYKRLTDCEKGDIVIIPSDDNWYYVTDIVEFKKIVVRKIGMRHDNGGTFRKVVIPWGAAMAITDVKNIY